MNEVSFERVKIKYIIFFFFTLFILINWIKIVYWTSTNEYNLCTVTHNHSNANKHVYNTRPSMNGNWKWKVEKKKSKKRKEKKKKQKLNWKNMGKVANKNKEMEQKSRRKNKSRNCREKWSIFIGRLARASCAPTSITTIVCWG